MIRLLSPRRLRRWWWKAKRLTIGDLITYAVFASLGAGTLAFIYADHGAPAATSCAPGPVTNVVDADTIDVGACRVRLLAVDAPETQWRSRSTPWCADYALGLEAKRVVESLTLGQPVTFGTTEDDSSGRDMAAEVNLPDGTELGGWLVDAGLAVPRPDLTDAGRDLPDPPIDAACPPGHGPGMEPSR